MKWYYLFFMTVMTCGSFVPANAIRQLRDKIEVVVHGSERSQIFCDSDQKRRGIDGRQRTISDTIFDELMYQDALRLKIPNDDDAVRDHLYKTLSMFGLKPGDEEKVFAQEGYSWQEGFEQFRIMYMGNIILEHKVKSQLVIPEEKIIAYYNEHPIIKEPAYKLSMTAIPLKGTQRQRKTIEQKVDAFIKTGKGPEVSWSEPFWLKKSEIAQELEFICTMNVDQIVKHAVPDTLNLYRLVQVKPERAVSLKKRYKTIVDGLKKPAFEESMLTYRKSLFDNATIIYV